MNIEKIKEYLKNYDGKEINLMEVCGTHTAAISENGIPSLISNKIHLVSGPGCPVCVTVSEYVDTLCNYALKDNTAVVTFGDMMRVPGSKMSLTDAKAIGGCAYMVYSPLDIIPLALKNKEQTFIFASVGFETTTPVYAMLLDEIIKQDIKNVKLLTALKTMPAAIDTLCQGDSKIDGFLAPGHVAAITGATAFLPLAKKYNLPFVVSPFDGEGLLMSIFALTKLIAKGQVLNMYKSVVKDEENIFAKNAVNKYFMPCNAAWRGLGIIENSGMILKPQYKQYDAGSENIMNDKARQNGCICGKVITGIKKPYDCPLFGKICTPESPNGACMVSHEGSCFNYFINSRKD